MTSKEKSFVEEYKKNGNNGAKAYMVAYGTDKVNTAKTGASKVLKRDHIKEALKEDPIEKVAVSKEDVKFFEELRNIRMVTVPFKKKMEKVCQSYIDPKCRLSCFSCSVQAKILRKRLMNWYDANGKG